MSLAVRAYDVLHAESLRWNGQQTPPSCVVLYYHAVPTKHRKLFARQMDLLLRIAEPISTESPPDMQLGRKYVAVTFDDGFVSVLENAAPELKSRRIPWTIFVPSGCLGQSPSWLRKAHPDARQDRVMTPDELRFIARDPLVTIGSHTVNHAHLVDIGSAKAATELAQSKSELEAIVGRAVTQFSYPFGAHTPTLDQQAFLLGFKRLFTTSPEISHQYWNEFLTGRFAVDPDISLLEFRLKILGAYRWMAARNRRATHLPTQSMKRASPLDAEIQLGQG